MDSGMGMTDQCDAFLAEEGLLLEGVDLFSCGTASVTLYDTATVVTDATLDDTHALNLPYRAVTGPFADLNRSF